MLPRCRLVGYTGGASSNPTYSTVCRGDGHTEALKVEYDPTKTSYEALMTRFFAEASAHKSKPQYMSAVWAQNAEQRATAERIARQSGKPIPVLDAKQWHDAEEYHQHYIDKQYGRR